MDDPWAEAERRRREGDLAGAVIYLFAHQLLSFSTSSGLIRVAPGRTGRHYVRWLRDPELNGSLGATLGCSRIIITGTGGRPRRRSSGSGLVAQEFQKPPQASWRPRDESSPEATAGARGRVHDAVGRGGLLERSRDRLRLEPRDRA